MQIRQTPPGLGGRILMGKNLGLNPYMLYIIILYILLCISFSRPINLHSPPPVMSRKIILLGTFVIHKNSLNLSRAWVGSFKAGFVPTLPWFSRNDSAFNSGHSS